MLCSWEGGVGADGVAQIEELCNTSASCIVYALEVFTRLASRAGFSSS